MEPPPSGDTIQTELAGLTEPVDSRAPSSPQSASALVAGGILLSRITGFLRESVFAYFFGTSLYADVFRAGVRMPNVLQNLLGEGTLSASFIPVYAELLEQGREEEAGRVAGAIFALLFAVAGALVLIGILLAPVLVRVFLPGWGGERRELAILVTRIIFPGTGLIVLSAWSLGILNSHRRFFIPYVAPVLWNGAMIATLLLFGDQLAPERLLIALAWGALVGGALQFGIQLPWVLRHERRLRIAWATRLEGVREAVRNAGPAIAGRGVVQLSSYVDLVLASLLAVGGLAAIGYAQTIYMLPVSLFGMSVAAAELPELSRSRRAAAEILRDRTSAALQRVAFYVVPSFVAFILLGDVLIAAVYERGEFDPQDTFLVYLTLLGYSTGLLASTATRLFSSTFFALRDTRTPARVAAIRVAVAAVLSFALMTQFEAIDVFGYQIGPGFFGELRLGDQPLGAIGLTLGGGFAAWLEWGLLRRSLRARIGSVGVGMGRLARMFAAALVGAGAGWGIRLALYGVAPLILAPLIVGAFAASYFAVAALLGLPESRAFFTRISAVGKRLR